MNKDDVREQVTRDRIQEAIDKAVAAERERGEANWHDANMRAEAAEAKLARLENPDEALVEAAFHAFVPAVNFRESLKLAIRALARALEENNDAKK